MLYFRGWGWTKMLAFVDGNPTKCASASVDVDSLRSWWNRSCWNRAIHQSLVVIKIQRNAGLPPSTTLPLLRLPQQPISTPIKNDRLQLDPYNSPSCRLLLKQT